MPLRNSKFTCLSVNIRSVSKNFYKLKECLKLTNHDYSVIELSETHFKEEPHEYYNLPGYKWSLLIELMMKKGGVCILE